MQSIFAHDITGPPHHLRALGLMAAFGADDFRDAAGSVAADTEEEAEAEDAVGAKQHHGEAKRCHRH